MAHKIKVTIKSITGRMVKEFESEFDKNLDKIVVTVDTAAVIKNGGDMEFVMKQVADTLQIVIDKNLPLIVLPEFIKIEFIKLEKIKESVEDVRESDNGTSN